MCGHVGIFGKDINTQTVSAFEDLLYMDALRGEHATGVAMISPNATARVIKKPLTAALFLDSADVATAMRSAASSVALLGHNRYATQGALNEENAHPFSHGHITMAHNGTLRTRRGLSGLESDYEVDSNHIAYTLSRAEPETFLGRLNGAYALVWHNSTENTISFARNNDRPMYIAKVKDKDIYMYASEIGMLYAAATRKKRDIVFDYVDELPIHTIRTYQLPRDFKTLVAQLPDVTYIAEAAEYDYGDWWSGYNAKPRYRVYSSGSTRPPVTNPHMAAMGVKTGDIVEFAGYEFVPYNMQSVGNVSDDKIYGHLVGYTEGPTVYETAIISGITKTRANQIIEHAGRVRASVSGTGNTAKGNDGKPLEPDNQHYLILAPSSVVLIDKKEKKNLPAVIDSDADELDEIRNSCDIDDDIPFDADVVVENGGNPIRYTRKRFNEITVYGCGMCGSDLFVDDVDTMRIYHNDSPICKSCHDKVVNDHVV